VPVPVLVDSVDQIAYLGVEWNEYRVVWVARSGPVRSPSLSRCHMTSRCSSAVLRIRSDFAFPTTTDPQSVAVLGPWRSRARTCTDSWPVAVRTKCWTSSAAVRSWLASSMGERSGDVSAVVDLTTNQWRVVREGAITTADIARVLAYSSFRTFQRPFTG